MLYTENLSHFKLFFYEIQSTEQLDTTYNGLYVGKVQVALKVTEPFALSIK